MISRRSSAPHPLHPTSSIGAAFTAFLATFAGIGSIGLSMTGCGPSIPPPRDRLHTTEAAIAVAEKSGADKVPNASEVLINARAGVARAKASMKEGKNREAEALLVRAGADAELADALAHEGEVAQEVAKAKARLAEDPSAKPVEENKK